VENVQEKRITGPSNVDENVNELQFRSTFL
jgi:hypothetical protein